jgi:hypothetical protein
MGQRLTKLQRIRRALPAGQEDDCDEDDAENGRPQKAKEGRSQEEGETGAESSDAGGKEIPGDPGIEESGLVERTTAPSLQCLDGIRSAAAERTEIGSWWDRRKHFKHEPDLQDYL